MNLALIIGMLARHMLTFGGGVAVTKGVVATDDVSAIVGAISTLAGLLWSAYRKYADSKKAAPITDAIIR